MGQTTITATRPAAPVPKASTTRYRTKRLTQAEINRTLAETPFYDRVREIVENGHGSVTIQLERATTDARPKLRLITTLSDQLPLPLVFS